MGCDVPDGRPRTVDAVRRGAGPATDARTRRRPRVTGRPRAARAPRGHAPAARLHPSQVVSDNPRQAPVPVRPGAPRSVPGPPRRSPAAAPVAPGPAPADRSGTGSWGLLRSPGGLRLPDRSHCEPAPREGQGARREILSFSATFPRSSPVVAAISTVRPQASGAADVVPDRSDGPRGGRRRAHRTRRPRPVAWGPAGGPGRPGRT